jgi:hypothetical protein
VKIFSKDECYRPPPAASCFAPSGYVPPLARCAGAVDGGAGVEERGQQQQQQRRMGGLDL